MLANRSLTEWGRSISDSQEKLNVELEEFYNQLRAWWDEAIRTRVGAHNPMLSRIVPQKDGISFEYEYNDACNCHPEYITATFLVPYSEIDKGVEYQIHMAKELNDKRELEQKELAKRREEQRLQDQKDAELRLLKSLKDKYEK